MIRLNVKKKRAPPFQCKVHVGRNHMGINQIDSLPILRLIWTICNQLEISQRCKSEMISLQYYEWLKVKIEDCFHDYLNMFRAHVPEKYLDKN